MPGRTKKKIYIGKCLADLNKRVEQQDIDKSNPRRLGNTAAKLIQGANEAYKDLDEERAFILYMRYALIWRTATESPQFKKDKKYFEDLFGKKNVVLALDRAEELSTSLETRYKDALEEEEVKAKLEKESNRGLTNGTVTDGTVENGEVEMPEERVLGSDGWVKASELYDVLKSNEFSVLVMDARSADQYASSQMKKLPSINVPSEIIKAGATVKVIERDLPSDSMPDWRRRGTFDYVILMDWDASEGDLKQGSTLTSLRDALYKWDSSKMLKHQPLILQGGYTDWILRYPMYSSNPRVAKPPSYESLMKPKSSLDFDYPDLDDKPPQQEVPPLPETPAPRQAPAKVIPSVNRTLKPQANAGPPPVVNSQAAPVMNVLANHLSEGSNRGVTSPPPETVAVSTKKNEGNEIGPAVPSVDRSVKPKHVGVKETSKEDEGKKQVERVEEGNDEMELKAAEDENAKREAEERAAEEKRVADTREREEREEFEALRQKEEAARVHLEQMRAEKTKMENSELRKEKQALEDNIRRQQEEMAKLKAEMEAIKARQNKPKPSGSSPAASAEPTSQDQTRPALPAGWEMKWEDKSRRYYYVNHSTKTTQWEFPGLAKEKPPPASASGQSGNTSTPVKGKSGEGTATKPAAPSQSISAQPASGRDQNKPDTLNLAQPVSPQGTTKVPLKSSSTDSPGPSTLKRSYSSPNIAKMVADEEQFRGVKTPTVDRSKKPAARPAYHPQQLVVRKRNLDPVYGSQARALTGLRNLGNTCFMNSVVQCLSNTTLLTKYFLEDTYMRDINPNNPLGRKGEVAAEFAVVVKALWAGQYKSIAPRDLLRTVIKYVPEFNQKIGHHHDSQEFLVFLMDGLHEDLNQVRERQYIKEEDFSHLPAAEGSARSWKNHLTLNKSIIVSLFQGQFRSVVRCLACKNDSIKYEAFMFLELPIPSKTKCSLQDCLEKFQSVEKLTGNNATMCSKCKKNQDSVKTIQIWRLPHILIIHLKRFYYEGMWRQKLQTNVDYPVTSLDMRRYTPNSAQGGGVYNLYGVSNHTGTLDGGHYTAYCKSAVNQRWYKYDDTEVFEYSVGKIRSSGAYILFYTSVPLHEP